MTMYDPTKRRLLSETEEVRIGAERTLAKYVADIDRLRAVNAELLTALKDAVDLIDGSKDAADPYFSDHPTRRTSTARKARAAIAKAEGRS